MRRSRLHPAPTDPHTLLIIMGNRKLWYLHASRNNAEQAARAFRQYPATYQSVEVYPTPTR